MVIDYGGDKNDLIVSSPVSCALPPASVPKETLFPNLPRDIQPIAVKSRWYKASHREFIASEVDMKLKDDVIQDSRSPWRAQVVVVEENGSRRMVIDYSQTINIYTEKDATPLPRLDETVNTLAKYRFFSKFDLKSAYHQIPILPSDYKYTAFEANGKLYEFKRIPYGVTNGGIVFQRAIESVIKTENLNDTFAWQDDVTVCGQSQEEHDRNVERFLNAVRARNFTLNEKKTVSSVSCINVLGYRVGFGEIRPDPDRLTSFKRLSAANEQEIFETGLRNVCILCQVVA